MKKVKHNFIHGFSKNSRLGSNLIRWGTRNLGQRMDATPSHYFIVFFRRIVVEANLANGVRITHWGHFQTKHDIIQLFIPIGEREIHEKHTKLFDRILGGVYGKPYDYMAVVYFAYRVLRKKFFGHPLPETNYFNHPDKFFCDEIYSMVSGRDMSMESPNDLYHEMLSREADYKPISINEVIL